MHRRSARWVFCTVLLLGAGLCSSPARADLHFHWQAAFDVATQTMVRAWLSESFDALESHVGELPIPVHVHVHRRSPANEPVPWAQTRRGTPQGVNFHIDPRFPSQAFRKDWTAAHEFSHLVLPYLGAEHTWFAEGFASFMQYQVMQAKGVLTAAEVEGLYRDKIARAQRNYRHPHKSFVDAAPQLRAEGRYPTLYWGGAVYFRRVDAALHASDSSLRQVLSTYLRCCRRDYDDLDHLLTTLDRLADTALFSQGYARLRNSKGFPEDVAHSRGALGSDGRAKAAGRLSNRAYLHSGSDRNVGITLMSRACPLNSYFSLRLVPGNQQSPCIGVKWRLRRRLPRRIGSWCLSASRVWSGEAPARYASHEG